PKFTTNPKNVKTLGLIPVAAIAPTILSSSHLLPVPIAPVKVAISWWECARFFCLCLTGANTRVSIVAQTLGAPQTPCTHFSSSGCCGRIGRSFARGISAHRFFCIDLPQCRAYSQETAFLGYSP